MNKRQRNKIVKGFALSVDCRMDLIPEMQAYFRRFKSRSSLLKALNEWLDTVMDYGFNTNYM